MDFTTYILLATLALKHYNGTIPFNRVSCGINRKASNKRIHDGEPTQPKDWPWMASLMEADNKRHFCGGTLFTDIHILTAAHCFIDYTKNDIIVRLGEHQMDVITHNNPATDFNVVDIQKHQLYNAITDHNDIAILKLDRPATFNEFIFPVCLPPPNYDFKDRKGYVIGWGEIFHGGPASNILLEVYLSVWNQNDCVNLFQDKEIVSTMLCIGDKTGTMDSCGGDSGGPFLLQIYPYTKWYIAGIVSFGRNCGLPKQPAVYTRVNMYLDWIEKNLI